MKIIIISILGILNVNCLFSQDTTWQKARVNEDLTISLSGKITKIDTTLERENKKFRLLLYKATSNYSVLGLTITPNGTMLNIEDKESLKIALKGITDGICKSYVEQGFNCKVNDTIIDGITCKKVLMLDKEQKSFPTMTSYVFLLNDRVYSFSQTPLIEDRNLLTNELNTYLSSIHFNHTDIKEQKFESRTESKAYNVGYLWGQILVFGAIVLVIGIVIRMIIKKNKIKNA